RTTAEPSTGRWRLPASALFLSTFGLPVSSLGCFSQAILPQMAPPQGAIFIFTSPSCDSHTPDGSAARAGREVAVSATAIAANAKANRCIRVAVVAIIDTSCCCRWLADCQQRRLSERRRRRRIVERPALGSLIGSCGICLPLNHSPMIHCEN